MKRTIVFTLFMAIVFSGVTFAQFNRPDIYKNYAYANYEFQHRDTAFHLDHYRGPVYYFHHFRANLYFVLVGNTTFIVPADIFRHYVNRPNFEWVPEMTFIALSRGSLDFYDSYMRFKYYANFYDDHPWHLRNNFQVSRRYRAYYGSRLHNRRYYRNRDKILRNWRTWDRKHRFQAKKKRFPAYRQVESRYVKRHPAARYQKRSRHRGSSDYRRNRDGRVHRKSTSRSVSRKRLALNKR